MTSEVATQWPARLTKVVAGQISRYRHARGMSVQQLADTVTNLGLPIQRPVLSNLENGRRHTISVAELLALAAALRVPPLLLVTPIGETDQPRSRPGAVAACRLGVRGPALLARGRPARAPRAKLPRIRRPRPMLRTTLPRCDSTPTPPLRRHLSVRGLARVAGVLPPLRR